MVLLKPGGRLGLLSLGLYKVIDPLAENGIGRNMFDLVPRNCLHHDPRVVGEFPQRRIQLPPHFVSGMIPRPAQIQGQLGKRIKSFDFHRQKAVDRVNGTGWFAHRISFNSLSDRTLASELSAHR